MTVYQIIGWADNFENSRSKTVEICSFVAMPNKQHGMGLTRILSAPDGAAMFGIWCLILQACSRQTQGPAQAREGWLTDNGKPDGEPWSVDDMALRWRQPVELVRRAVDIFVNVKIGWMKVYSQTPSSTAETPSAASQLPASCQPADVGREGKGTEGNGKEGKGEEAKPPPTDSKESAGSPSKPPPDGDGGPEARKRLLVLLTLNGSTMKLGDVDIFHEWCTTCLGYSFADIQAVFARKPAPRLPSDLRKALRKIAKNSH